MHIRREVKIRKAAGLSQMQVAVRADSSTHLVRLIEHAGLQAVANDQKRARFAQVYDDLALLSHVQKMA